MKCAALQLDVVAKHVAEGCADGDLEVAHGVFRGQGQVQAFERLLQQLEERVVRGSMGI